VSVPTEKVGEIREFELEKLEGNSRNSTDDFYSSLWFISRVIFLLVTQDFTIDDYSIPSLVLDLLLMIFIYSSYIMLHIVELLVRTRCTSWHMEQLKYQFHQTRKY
jgi:hypothetical protein